MENNAEPQVSTTPSTPPVASSSSKGAMSVGPIAVIIIIVGVLAAGAWYFLNQNLGNISNNAPAATVEELQNSNDPDVQAALNQSSSDELDSIQADVSATDFSGIDASVDAVVQ